MTTNAQGVFHGKKINGFGIRTTGRIYKQCNRCRETIENGRERKKMKKKTGKNKK